MTGKKMLTTGMILGFILCLTGCGKREDVQYPWKLTESEREVQNADGGIVLQVEEASVTAEGMRISIQNNSDTEITFGTEYFIQLRKDGSWYDIDADTDWTLELFTAEPGQAYEEALDWSSYYGELPPGTYRIVKEYEKTEVKSCASCEFEVAPAEPESGRDAQAAIAEPQEGSEEGQEPWTVQGSGSILAGDAASEAAAPTEAQQAPILAFMDAYYQSMAYLQLQDLSGLFTEDEEHARFRAQVDGTAWTAVTDNSTQEEMHRAVFTMILGIRQASGLDLRLLSYNYELEVQNIEDLGDGCVQIEAVEYADMRFAHTPDAESQVTGAWHSFVIKETDGQWRLTHHAAYDSAYFSFIRWENSGTGRATGGASAGGFKAMAEERIQGAREQIERRAETAGSRSSAVTADHAYDREAAAAYAREWAGGRNPQWGVYDGAGGNCMNYVSQCLYASGIPMDQSGDAQWYWYSDSRRAPAWTGVVSFRDYVRNNSGYGLCAQAGVPWHLGQTGDVILMSTAGNYHHAVIITQVVQGGDGSAIDYLICSNTGNYRDFPVSAYVYAEQELVRITGWNG